MTQYIQYWGISWKLGLPVLELGQNMANLGYVRSASMGSECI